MIATESVMGTPSEIRTGTFPAGIEAGDFVRARRGGDVFVGDADLFQHPQDTHGAAFDPADDLVGFRHIQALPP
jgi:hypothetical protein